MNPSAVASATDASATAPDAAPQVWVVDDDASIRFVLERALARAQLPVQLFDSAHAVWRALQQHESAPSVLVTDMRMPGEDGLQLLARVRALRPRLPVVVMTAYADLDSAVQALQGGAFEFLPKPFDVVDAIALIRRAAQGAVTVAAHQPGELDANLLGQARSMQEVFRAIGRLSKSAMTVLITGESGSGKELIARALHQHSQRAQGAFVAINTAAIPRELLESELFGHERGAFTGAQQQHVGRFEQAAGGTLFLDEIGDMPLELQTRLLRVLSEGGFYRVGGRQLIRSQARVIAATHQDLEARVRAGQFREDLYHRLNVIRLRVPSLRERAEDIPLLAGHFLRQSAQQLETTAKQLSDEALALIARYAFPGNVRQLQNLCHWLTVMAPGPVVLPDDLPPEFHAASPSTHAASPGAVEALAPAPEPNPLTQGAGATVSTTPGHTMASPQPGADWNALLAEAVRQAAHQHPGDVMQTLSQIFESTVYSTALALTHGRRLQTAKLLGVGRNTVTRKVAELGLASQED